MYTSKRKLLSQNFLYSRCLIAKLIRSSSIGKDDLVLEIGPGKGIITQALVSQAGFVMAVELDQHLYQNLKQKLGQYQNITLIQGNFLDLTLPQKPYKVFANIPFRLTSDIIKKLLNNPYPPRDSYLVVQKESAQRFMGKVNNYSMLSALYYPWFSFSISYTFQRSDFTPQPSVDSVLLRIEQRTKPLVENQLKGLYQDMLAVAFNRFRGNARKNLESILTNRQFNRLAQDLRFSPNTNPSQISPIQWLGIGTYVICQVEPDKRKSIHGTFQNLMEQQAKVSKLHRTRQNGNTY